jgi:uncharacterized protein YkwD
LPHPGTRIPSALVGEAIARAGFPGQARMAKILNGGAFPLEVVDGIRADVGLSPVDVASAVRRFGDGTALWLVVWAPHLLDLDPLPRDVGLDARVPIRVSDEGKETILLLTPPNGLVQELALMPEAHRWVGGLHVPGPYRFEVVTQDEKSASVALLFTVYVDSSPGELILTEPTVSGPPNPIVAEQWLFEQVNQLRSERGLSALRDFPLFVPLAREHAAWMANTGVVEHQLHAVTKGVAHHAANLAHPRAKHRENIAAAFSAGEALALAVDSPGHLQAFLCGDCTHMAIGAAIEPVLHTQPRLFVTWEMLSFPQGEPVEIDDYNR